MKGNNLYFSATPDVIGSFLLTHNSLISTRRINPALFVAQIIQELLFPRVGLTARPPHRHGSTNTNAFIDDPTAVHGSPQGIFPSQTDTIKKKHSLLPTMRLVRCPHRVEHGLAILSRVLVASNRRSFTRGVADASKNSSCKECQMTYCEARSRVAPRTGLRTLQMMLDWSVFMTIEHTDLVHVQLVSLLGRALKVFVLMSCRD